MESIRSWHRFTGMSCQSCWTTIHSWVLFIGFTIDIALFTSPTRFQIGFKSENRAGHVITSISCAILELLANKLLSLRRLWSVWRLIARFNSFLIYPAVANEWIVAYRTICLSSTAVVLSFPLRFSGFNF